MGLEDLKSLTSKSHYLGPIIRANISIMTYPIVFEEFADSSSYKSDEVIKMILTRMKYFLSKSSKVL